MLPAPSIVPSLESMHTKCLAQIILSGKLYPVPPEADDVSCLKHTTFGANNGFCLILVRPQVAVGRTLFLKSEQENSLQMCGGGGGRGSGSDTGHADLSSQPR